MQRLIVVVLLMCLPLVGIADPNNVSGRQGLIMIDKLGKLVRFFDPANFSEVSSLKIGGTPHELVISPDHRTAYVSDYGDGVYGRNPNPGHTIAVIDLISRKLTGVIDIAPYQAPHGMQVDASGMLYVICDLSRKLLIVDPATQRVIADIDTEGTGHWVALLPDASKAYVASKNDRPFVSVIDIKARRMMGNIPMPRGTQGIAASPDGKRVLAMDMSEPRIVVIDTATDKISDEIALDGHTAGAWLARYSPDGAHLVAINASENVANILVADDLHRKQITVKTGKQSFGVAFNADSSKALIPNHGDGTITVIDLHTGKVVETFKAGTGIEALSYY